MLSRASLDCLVTDRKCVLVYTAILSPGADAHFVRVFCSWNTVLFVKLQSYVSYLPEVKASHVQRLTSGSQSLGGVRVGIANHKSKEIWADLRATLGMEHIRDVAMGTL